MAGAGCCDGGKRRISRPAGDGGTAFDEARGEEEEKSEEVQPEAERVEQRKGHAAGANLQRHDERAEAGLRGERHDEEEHEGAVQGDEREVVLWLEGAEEGECVIRPDKVGAHGERHQGSDGDSGE